MSAREMRSQEFRVTMGKTLEGIEYPVRVSSPAGSATGAFVLPFSMEQIEKALQNFREGISSGRYRRKRTRGRIQDTLSPEGFGSDLFRALFKDEVLSLYRESLSMAGKPVVDANRMPVKLNIAARELARLPWEFLYDPEGDDFLSFGKDTPVIRFIDTEPRPYTFDPPLRVLLVSAKPSDRALLDLDRERKVIGEALDSLRREGKIRIDHLFGATIPELRSEIRGYEPHVVHFMGHGQVNRLWLEDREGRGSSLAQSGLGIILRNVSSLRMVVLSASETTRPTDSEERLGLARGLARRGVPAIVAMQFEISDEAACEFAGELYRVLAGGFGVDEAVLWGRIAVQNRFVDDIEWATPVLYMQAREGKIFDDLLRGPKAEVQVDELSATRKKRIEVLREQLRIRERNLWRLETQKAKLGMLVPVHIVSAIDEEQVAIRQICEELNQLGVDKEAIEPQEGPALEIPDAYREDVAVDIEGRLADLVVTEEGPSVSIYQPDVYPSAPTSEEPSERLQALDPRLLEQVQTYYEQGLRHFDESEWARTLTFLEDVQRLAPGYKDTQRLLRTAREELAKQEAERSTKEKLAALYRQALTHYDEERWQAAVDLFEEILRIAPNFEDAEIRAEKARRAHAQQLAEERTHLRLETLHQRAQQCLEAEDWGQAIGLLEQIVQIDRGYDNVLDQLNEAQLQKQLVELYARGEEAFVAQDWEQAVANFGAAFAIDKSYKDVEEKLEQARQQRRWDDLYQEGLEYLEAERWDGAIETFKKVQPDRKRRKDVKVARLYAEGRQYAAQGKWEPALARFKEIIEKSPQYQDASERLQEVRRQKRFHDLYIEGLQRAGAQEWRQAIRAFEQIDQEAPHYRDVQSRLALVREEVKLAERYALGKRFFDLGRWNEAIQDFQSIVQVRPDYPNAQEMLKEAIRQQKLADLYAEGMRCLTQGQWQEAIDAFEKLVDTAPDYRDAARQLDDARNKKSLNRVYEQGRECYEREDWTGAIQYLEKVMGYEKEGYRDAEALLAEAKRQERLAQLYQEGLDYRAVEDWDKAVSSFEQVVELDRNYKNAAERLAEAQRQKWLAGTYAEGELLMEAEQWGDAATVFQQILENDPHYRQAPALLAEAQRQHRLAMLYAAANQAYEEEHWTEAIERVQQIIKINPDYRDTRDLLRKAEQGRRADWKSRMLSSLQDSGKLAAQSLNYVPERFHLDIMRGFYEEYSKNLELSLSTDFQLLTLLDFDLVSALRNTWEAMLSAAQSEQIGSAESRPTFWAQLKRVAPFGSEPAKSVDTLVDELTNQLCSALGFVRAPDPDGDRQHKQLHARMIRTPTLHYKLPYRFPLIIFAKRLVETADVRDLLDLMSILERTINFAFLVTLGDADQLRMLLDQEVFEHDFVVLSRHNLEQILLSRDKTGQLTETILEQVNLTVISPYRVAGPVPERMFFGREKEIRMIRDAIRDTNVALTGGRRIGKTSTLQKVQRILTTELDYEAFHLDCQAVDTHEGFFGLLAEKLSEQPCEPPKTFRQAIETIRGGEDKLVVVLLDEVDDLLQYDLEQWGERLFKEFRSLSQEGYCNFIFCGGKTLYKRTRNPDSPFFNFCHSIVLRFLSEESATRIIIQPMSDMGIELKDQDELVARILDVSSCHPNLVQLICMRLVENIKERTISLDDLQKVITSEDFYTSFKDIAWGQAKPLEKIASLTFVENESFTTSEAYQRLAEFGIEDRKSIDDALDTLELYSLITKRGKGYEYDLSEFPRIVRETEDTKTLMDSLARQISKET